MTDRGPDVDAIAARWWEQLALIEDFLAGGTPDEAQRRARELAREGEALLRERPELDRADLHELRGATRRVLLRAERALAAWSARARERGRAFRARELAAPASGRTAG